VNAVAATLQARTNAFFDIDMFPYQSLIVARETSTDAASRTLVATLASQEPGQRSKSRSCRKNARRVNGQNNGTGVLPTTGLRNIGEHSEISEASLTLMSKAAASDGGWKIAP
jgi:hypothetical protein